MILFATTFQLPYFNDLYLLKNNSLITFFNYDSLNQQNSELAKKNTFFNTYTTTINSAASFPSIAAKSLKSSNSDAFPSKNFNSIVVDLGNWFFNQAFIYKINHKFLYVTKSTNFFNLVSKKCLLINYLSKFGNGFKVSCTLVGVGYRVTQLKSNTLVLKLGRSYKVKYFIPKFVNVKVFGKRKTKIRFFSTDLVRLMTSIYLFRLLKWPDSYKGKGIKITKQKSLVKFREKFGSIHYKGKK